MLAILCHINVGTAVCEGVNLCYENSSTRLIVNNMLSDKIPIKSSVRQGCPLSPLLFALYLEPFCLSILESQNIRGISAEVKVLAYADDVAVFCTDKKKCKRSHDRNRKVLQYYWCVHEPCEVQWVLVWIMGYHAFIFRRYSLGPRLASVSRSSVITYQNQ